MILARVFWDGLELIAVAAVFLAGGGVGWKLCNLVRRFKDEPPPKWEPRNRYGVPYSQWSDRERDDFDRRIHEAELEQGN